MIAILSLMTVNAEAADVYESYVSNCKSRVKTLPGTDYSAESAHTICMCIKNGFESTPSVKSETLRKLIDYRKKYGHKSPVGAVKTDDLNILLEFEGQLFDECVNPDN